MTWPQAFIVCCGNSIVFLAFGGIAKENLGGSTNGDFWLRANNNTTFMHNEFAVIAIKQNKTKAKP